MGAWEHAPITKLVEDALRRVDAEGVAQLQAHLRDSLAAARAARRELPGHPLG